jgi:hypothetical protein
MTPEHDLPPRPTPAELAQARWFKAQASNGGQGCVEVAHLQHWIVVRDSKNPGGPVHRYTPREWACFLDGARNGEFDRPALSLARVSVDCVGGQADVAGHLRAFTQLQVSALSPHQSARMLRLYCGLARRWDRLGACHRRTVPVVTEPIWVGRPNVIAVRG